MRSGSADRKTFRTGDMAAVAIAFLVVLTPINYIVLSTPAAPGVDVGAGLVFYVPYLVLTYLGLIRAAMIKVRVDDRGVFVRNFWTSRTYEWDEFGEFLSPGDGVKSTRSSALLRTAAGDLKPMTAIQARNINLIRGRKDDAAEKLIREMSDAASRALARRDDLKQNA
jgi:hypothetical protein